MEPVNPPGAASSSRKVPPAEVPAALEGKVAEAEWKTDKNAAGMAENRVADGGAITSTIEESNRPPNSIQSAATSTDTSRDSAVDGDAPVVTAGGVVASSTAAATVAPAASAAAASGGVGSGVAPGGGADAGDNLTEGDRESGAVATNTLLPSFQWSNNLPPSPPPLTPSVPQVASFSPHIPLGRDKPIQFLTREAATATATTTPAKAAAADGNKTDDKSYVLLQWPRTVSGANTYHENLPSLENVGKFPENFSCSLTEADKVPGLSGSGGAGGHKLQQKTWTSSGPCVISCSSPLGGNDDNEGGGGDEHGYCRRAFRACEFYQECTHILLPPPPFLPPPVPAVKEGPHSEQVAHMKALWYDEEVVEDSVERPPPPKPEDGNNSGNDAYAGFATLMHLPKMDGSMKGVLAAATAEAWGEGGKGGFSLDARPRTYYVVSFGGSGSKMLGGWLSERGEGLVKEVGGFFHSFWRRYGSVFVGGGGAGYAYRCCYISASLVCFYVKHPCCFVYRLHASLLVDPLSLL